MIFFLEYLGHSLDSSEYDPDILDDPELRSGRYRKVLNLSSFMVSVLVKTLSRLMHSA